MKHSQDPISGIELLEVVKKRLLIKLKDAEWEDNPKEATILKGKLEDVIQLIDSGELYYVPF
jgi:hypothetical protein